MPTLILYTKANCKLCHQARALLDNLAGDLEIEIEERDITESPLLYERLRYFIPVIEVPGNRLIYPPHSPETILDALAVGHSDDER